MTTIKIGEEYSVEMMSNPSTGFSWSYLPSKSKIVSIEESIGQANPNIVGSTLKSIFTIKGLQKGTEEITFNYHKVWENNIAPEKTKNLTITVE